MRDHETELAQAGACVAAVGLGDRRHAQAFRADTGIGFPLLVDEERVAYRAAGLQEATALDLLRPSVLAAGARAFGEGYRQHRTGTNPMQLGGSFVFAPGNVDLLVHVSAHFADNAPLHVLLHALRS